MEVFKDGAKWAVGIQDEDGTVTKIVARYRLKKDASTKLKALGITPEPEAQPETEEGS